MKFFAALLLTIFLSFTTGLFFPWWTIAVSAFVVALVIPQRPVMALLAALLALMLLWGGLAYIIDVRNGHLLATRVASLLLLGGSPVIIIIVTAFVGGLVGGMAALTGSILLQLFTKKRTSDRQVILPTE